MDLSFPLATVAPTLDAGVLQVLAATTAGCTAAEVQRRMAHGSDEGVRKVLARLAGQGVVVVDSASRYPVYRLNRDHVAARHIENLSNVRDEILSRIKQVVADWSIAPLHAGLFGSFARGDAGSDSDIDVLLVRPKRLVGVAEAAWFEQLDELGSRIRVWTGNDAQIVDVAPTALRQMDRQHDPLIDSWRVDDIWLYGERFMDLLRQLR